MNVFLKQTQICGYFPEVNCIGPDNETMMPEGGLTIPARMLDSVGQWSWPEKPLHLNCREIVIDLLKRLKPENSFEVR